MLLPILCCHFGARNNCRPARQARATWQRQLHKFLTPLRLAWQGLARLEPGAHLLPVAYYVSYLAATAPALHPWQA